MTIQNLPYTRLLHFEHMIQIPDPFPAMLRIIHVWGHFATQLSAWLPKILLYNADAVKLASEQALINLWAWGMETGKKDRQERRPQRPSK